MDVRLYSDRSLLEGTLAMETLVTKFNGKIVLVTGASSGIGEATARTGPSRSVIPIDPDQRFQAIPIRLSD